MGLGKIAEDLLQLYNITSEQLAQEPTQRLRYRLIGEVAHTVLQNRWTNDAHPYLFRTIKPTLEDWQTTFHSSRQKERILARIRIGHTRVTHLHLILRTEPPSCDTCNTSITITHLLNDCREYAHHRASIYGTPQYKVYETLADYPIRIRQLFYFLRITGLFSLI